MLCIIVIAQQVLHARLLRHHPSALAGWAPDGIEEERGDDGTRRLSDASDASLTSWPPIAEANNFNLYTIQANFRGIVEPCLLR